MEGTPASDLPRARYLLPLIKKKESMATKEKNERRINRVLILKEWLDSRVSETFSDYCQTFGIHRAYGVESYQIGGWGTDRLRIVQDTSARGCHNTNDHDLPLDYLYLDRPERLELMQQHKAAKDKSASLAERVKKRAELEHAERTAARLRQELDG